MSIEKIKIINRFVWIEKQLEESLINLIDLNITKKIDSYLKKYYNKKDCDLVFNINIEKNKKWKFESTFQFVIDWEKIIYRNDQPFKNVDDLVNHAFDHLKRALSDKD